MILLYIYIAPICKGRDCTPGFEKESGAAFMMPAIGMIPMSASRMSVAFFIEPEQQKPWAGQTFIMNINPTFPAQSMLVLP